MEIQTQTTQTLPPELDTSTIVEVRVIEQYNMHVGGPKMYHFLIKNGLSVDHNSGVFNSIGAFIEGVHDLGYTTFKIDIGWPS